MNRDFKVLVISVINGMFIFLLFMRYWRLERYEILSANHFVSVVLVSKIIYNLLTVNGNLNADCLWNTSVLIFYVVFRYTADHHEFIKDYSKSITLSSLTRYGFRQNFIIPKNIDFAWVDCKLIVSCVLLATVVYNPFVTNTIKARGYIRDDYVELIRKYKHLKRKKQMKKVFKLKEPKEYIPIQRNPNQDAFSESKIIGFILDRKQQRKLKTSNNNGFTKVSSDYKSMGSLQKGDGAGDKKCSLTIISYCDQRTITTQTVLSEVSQTSIGIQCNIVSSVKRSSKAFMTRPVGSATGYLSFGSEKSTNTYSCYMKQSKSKLVTSKENLRFKQHKSAPIKEQQLIIEAQKSIMQYNNLRKQIQKHFLNTSKRPSMEVDICSYKQKDHDIFKLDDLMHGTDAWYRKKGITKGLDVFPSKDHPSNGDEMNSLNVLYCTDKTVNSAQATNPSAL